MNNVLLLNVGNNGISDTYKLESLKKNNSVENTNDENENDFIEMYLDEIVSTDDSSSSFYRSRGLQSLDCVMIDLFIGIN